jgi:hypothetical protein
MLAGPTSTVDDEPLGMCARQLAPPCHMLAVHRVVVAPPALARRGERPSIVEHGEIQPRLEAGIVRKSRRLREVVPRKRSRCGE